MGASNDNKNPDHAHSPHSVFAKRYLITRPRAPFCCWRPHFCPLNSQRGKQPLCTIYIAAFSNNFIWHFIGKGRNSFFSLVGGVAMKTPGLLIFMMNIHDSSNLYQADFVALSFPSLLLKQWLCRMLYLLCK